MAKRTFTFVGLIAALLISGAPTLADETGDHDQARALYQEGDVRGLAHILKRVIATTPGDVVRVDLVPRDGAWVYRLEIVQANGQRRIVEISASAGDDYQVRSQGE